MPSPSGPQRPDPAHGASRHAHRVEADHAGHESHAGRDGHGDDSWFAVVLRGYDRGQVDTRLADLDHRIHSEIRRAEAAEHALESARAQMRRLQAQADAATSERRSDDPGFGRSVERVLQAAEQEAAELRERAGAEADRVRADARAEADRIREQANAEAEQTVARADSEADERRTRTEEALLARAAVLDKEFAARRAELDERADVADARERSIAERERAVEERIGSARSDAEDIVATARVDAEDIRNAARDQAADTVADAERDAGEARAAVTRDVQRLASLRDEVRGELDRIRESLTTELAREPVAASLDDALFGVSLPTGRLDGDLGDGGSVATVSDLPTARGAVVGRGAAGTTRPDESPGTGGDDEPVTPSWPSSVVTDDDDRGAESRADQDTGGASGSTGSPDRGPGADADASTGSEPVTGTLLLGPGHRAPDAEADPDVTTVGQIPPISLTSIGVLPFGDLGTGRDNPRTRTDGVSGTSRAHRGPTRGPGSGRRSR